MKQKISITKPEPEIEIEIETEYEPIIMAGVAAQIISGRDLPMVTQNYITESLQAAVYPVGSSTSIRNSLLQYQQILRNVLIFHVLFLIKTQKWYLN